MFLKLFRHWREQKQLKTNNIADAVWKSIVSDSLIDFKLNHQELQRLRKQASLFLLRKTITGAGGLDVNDYMRAVISAQACLLTLNLDLDYYDGWVEIILYPDAFFVTREVRDEAGVIHKKRSLLGGEAWSRGPLILSWNDARPGTQADTQKNNSGNVIIHEFAHKLDMLDGAADGTPPLHPDMSLRDWINSFTESYTRLQQNIKQHHHTRIDPYAAENPAEFFAVVSEAFFCTPQQLFQYNKDVYQQLCLFYRQQPLQRCKSR